MREQSLDLRGEPHLFADGGIEQRFFARPVPSQDEPRGRVVPDRQSERGVELGNPLDAAVEVKRENRLDVGTRAEGESAVAPVQGRRIVDLAVAREPAAWVLRREGLVGTVVQID